MSRAEEKPEKSFDVVVVGACFCDFLTYVPSYPSPGETTFGSDFVFDFGGKGANMCVMAAKLGARAAMVSIVGDDVFGRETLGNFNKFAVNTECINVCSECATGITNCIVDDSGEPAFISVPGASKQLTSQHVHQAKSIIKKGKILLTNQGVPLSTALEALTLAKSCGLTTIFNPAPKPTELADEFYANTDILVLNMQEAEHLTNNVVRNKEQVLAACLWFHERGVPQVVITMRENGAIGSEKNLQSGAQAKNLTRNVFHASAKEVNVVDTTGAGDALTGALAFFLSSYPQLSFKEMAMRSVAIATRTVGTQGVQKSYPDRECLPGELFA